ncbi:hypothetical protein [Mucisphaera sp.]|uniref:hypothetical protein n=1 Tax=Mucisphaera sp. TaxID=2913024 RepID=UPI003D109121
MTESRTTTADYATKIGLHKARVQKLLPLTYLGPQILKAVLTGTLSPRITLNDLLQAARHLDWDQQAKMLGLAF